MCGRYYVDDETAKEIKKIVRKIDGRLHGTDGFRINAGDVCPSAVAPVLPGTFYNWISRLKKAGYAIPGDGTVLPP